MTVLRTDGTTTKAEFRGAGGDPLRLVLERSEPHSQRAPQRLELPVSEIARLDAPPKAQFSVSRCVLSILGGMGAGALLGALWPADHHSSGTIYLNGLSQDGAYPYSQDSRIGAIASGDMAGALTGAVVGVFVGAGHGPPRSWSCPDPAPGAVEATPDSAQVPIR